MPNFYISAQRRLKEKRKALRKARGHRRQRGDGIEDGKRIMKTAQRSTRPFGLQMWCPPEAGPGALVVLLDGGLLPFVLRPRSDGEEEEPVCMILGPAVQGEYIYILYTLRHLLFAVGREAQPLCCGMVPETMYCSYTVRIIITYSCRLQTLIPKTEGD